MYDDLGDFLEEHWDYLRDRIIERKIKMNDHDIEKLENAQDKEEIKDLTDKVTTEVVEEVVDMDAEVISEAEEVKE